MKPQVPEVLDKFRAYHERNVGWGHLHVVLDDENMEDKVIDWTIEQTAGSEDMDTQDAHELAKILRSMSRRQRKKIARTA